MDRDFDPTRRRVLALAGGSIVATAGCLSDEADDSRGADDGNGDRSAAETDDDEGVEGEDGDGNDEDTGDEGDDADPEDTDGEGDEDEDANDADEDSEGGEEDDGEAADAVDEAYSTETFEGVGVPLVPIDDAYEWYDADDARFVDARGESQYDRARIAGAVLSSAPDGLPTDDPVDDWPEDALIVTYCGCPHHLSGLRAASLIEDGYEAVYALDEGFFEWQEREYPLEGADVDDAPDLLVVRGAVDPDFAGEMVLAEHEPTGQLEAAPIDDDGGYELHVRFADLEPTSELTIETPDYTAREAVATLEDGVVDKTGSVN